MYHRDHGLPVASDAGTSPVVAADAPPPARDCLWTEIVDADHGFVLLLNADHVCVYASAGVRDVLGCEPETLVGTRAEDHLDADQLSQVWRTRAAVAAGGRHVLTRVRYAGSDQRDRWFDASSSRVRDPHTHTEYTAIHTREVTHELELQSALTRSEQRHAALLDAVDHAVFQLDANLRIASFNQPALSLLGRPADQLLGRGAFATVDLRDEDGRGVTDPEHRVLTGQDDAWCTVAGADGGRVLVQATLASYGGARPGDAGHLLLLCEAGRSGVVQSAPSLKQARAAAGLTAREGDVLDGLAAGGDVPTIARRLGISVHSVRGHVKSITAKLGVHSQLQAVIAASRRGMIDLTQEPRFPPA